MAAGLVERDLQWSSRVREHAETQAQENLSLMGTISTEVQTLHQVKLTSVCRICRFSGLIELNLTLILRLFSRTSRLAALNSSELPSRSCPVGRRR